MKKYLPLLIIIACILIAYSSSINGTWAMDDVVANKPVGIHDIQDLLSFRKVTSATFLLNQAIAPFNPASFRIFNIVIHILNTILVYILTLKTLTSIRRISESGGAKIRDQGHRPALDADHALYGACISSAIFALHPININAVAYIVQRMASLATLFVLLAILSYIAAHQSKNPYRTLIYYVLSGISVVLGIFSKENAVMVIPLIFLYDYVFLSAFQKRKTRKMIIAVLVLGFLSFGFATFFLRLHSKIFEITGLFLHPGQPLPWKDWMSIDVSWTAFEHILSAFRVLTRYLFLLLFPFPRFLVFDWWGFPVSHGITDPITTLPSMILVISLTIFSLAKLKRYPFISFGILWYFLAISLESFLALGTDLYYEHRNYLPLTGLSIGIAGQTMASFKGKIHKRSAWVIVIIICSTLGALTFTRNFVWKDSVTLWGDTLEKNPSNIRAIMAMGNASLKLNNMKGAERYYREAVRISSNDRKLYYLNESFYSLGMLYLMNRELQQAKELINKFSHRIESYKPRILTGFYMSLSSDADGALREYRAIAHETKGIDRVVVYTLMGDAYRDKGLWNRALEKYRESVSLDPGFSSAYYGIGASYLGKRDIQQARHYISKALSIDPNHILALSDMADLILMMKSDPDEAMVYAQRAVSQSPPYYQPYLTMGNVLIVTRREHEAEEFYNNALEQGAPEYLVPFSKARSYLMRGDKEKAYHFLSELKKYEDIPEKIRSILQMNP
ncbi:MAG: tetratricopeptide repeat protein [Nitrospiraceae bacterium]|nr:MAG: tetratricopeptide repeat protein [Nitrospiraceae bacterium]